MSGHSKWSTIKHKKGKADAARGKVFTKIGREIVVAVKESGADPVNNSKLRDVIAKAKAANMPNDNIKRSIKKASGELGDVHYDEIVYEGYGPNGVAIMVESMTDNRNRTAAEVRHHFDKYGGSLGSSGCVSYMFDRKGVLIIEATDQLDEETVMMLALDAGAEDIISHGEAFEIITDPGEFSLVREEIEKQNIFFASAQIERVPQTMIKCTGELVEKVERIIEMLEDLDDVQNVYHNAEFE